MQKINGSEAEAGGIAEPFDPGPGLLKIGEVIRILGVDRKTLWDWDKKGKLPCIKDWRGTRFYTRSQVEEVYARMKLNGSF